jgi:hypothetical protein
MTCLSKMVSLHQHLVDGHSVLILNCKLFLGSRIKRKDQLSKFFPSTWEIISKSWKWQ